MKKRLSPNMSAAEIESLPAICLKGDVARILGVCPATVVRMAKRGELSSKKISGRHYFSTEEVLQLVGYSTQRG